MIRFARLQVPTAEFNVKNDIGTARGSWDGTAVVTVRQVGTQGVDPQLTLPLATDANTRLAGIPPTNHCKNPTKALTRT